MSRPCTIHERGNGFPDVGEYVAGDDGELYIVEEIGRSIFTGGPGSGNWVYGRVRLADWSDVADDDEPRASAEVMDDDEPDDD